MKYLLFFGLLSSPAFAVLGGGVATIDGDRHTFSANSRRVESSALYSVHTLSGDATTLKEYVNRDGVVFAVTWLAEGNPDLESMLGTHFGTYARVKSAQPKVLGRRPLSVQNDQLVVRHWGHMGALHGLAYLPSLVPAGVNAEVLK